jgi:damage-control phosphatase, subfamily I
MKFSIDCFPCIVRQAMRVIKKSGMDEQQQIQAMQQVLRALYDEKPGANSLETVASIQAILRRMTGTEDIYRKDKEKSTQEALAVYPRWREEVLLSADPLEYAVRLSIAGNIIDFASADSYDLDATILRVLKQPFAKDDLEALRKKITKAGRIIFMADNAGETVFDRILIETMQKPVTYVVKDAPILNDATLEDAKAAGLDKVAEIISSGSRFPGTILASCSPDFIERFRQADLIISKGMGNYEGLSAENAPIFFLLQVKCGLVEQDLGVPCGSIVVDEK